MKRPLLVLLMSFALGCAQGGGRDPDAAGTDGGVAPADGGGLCTLTVCGAGDCVDTATDRRHCGGCNMPCAGECTLGGCMATDCRTEGLGCPDGSSCDPGTGECVTVMCPAGMTACGAECCPVTGFAAPEDLSVSGHAIGLAVDPTGEPTVLYVSGDTARSLLLRRRVNGTWEQSTITSAMADIAAALAVDPMDRAHVVWTQDGSDGLFYAIDGGAAERFGDAPFLSPAVALIGGARPIVGYGVGSPIEVRLADRAGVWTSELVAERAEPTPGAVAFALGPADAPAFAFTRAEAGPAAMPDLRFAMREAGVWSDERIDDSGTTGTAALVAPQLAVTSAGVAHVVYWREDVASASTQLWHASRALDGTWARAVVDATTSPGRDLSIRVARDGEIHVAYFDGERVVHGRSAGVGFALTTVSAARDALEVDLALDSGGRPRVLYRDELDALWLVEPL